MLRFLCFACVWSAGFAIAGAAEPLVLDKSQWKVVWEDDFSGPALDRSKWQRCPEWPRQGGHCEWNNRNSFVDGKGNLILTIVKNGRKIQAGAVRTKGLFECRYGYFEIRCRVPVIKGGWCAFWMMPANGMPEGDRGREGTEIDIFESIQAERGEVSHALHWGGYEKTHQVASKILKNQQHLYDGRFHTYGVYWGPTQYIFFIDGVETWRSDAGGVLQKPAYLKISLESAEWAGDIHSEALPKQVEVDYVRVYGG